MGTDTAIRVTLVACAIGNFYFAYKLEGANKFIHIVSGLLALAILFS